jgi:hypothetical protein
MLSVTAMLRIRMGGIIWYDFLTPESEVQSLKSALTVVDLRLTTQDFGL